MSKSQVKSSSSKGSTQVLSSSQTIDCLIKCECAKYKNRQERYSEKIKKFLEHMIKINKTKWGNGVMGWSSYMIHHKCVNLKGPY